MEERLAKADRVFPHASMLLKLQIAGLRPYGQLRDGNDAIPHVGKTFQTTRAVTLVVEWQQGPLLLMGSPGLRSRIVLAAACDGSARAVSEWAEAQLSRDLQTDAVAWIEGRLTDYLARAGYPPLPGGLATHVQALTERGLSHIARVAARRTLALDEYQVEAWIAGEL